MPVPMKIFIFPLTLALSLGLTGWMFASYRQNQEQFRQAGQKTADLEKEKSLFMKILLLILLAALLANFASDRKSVV